jgi:hypothetical protein
LDAPPFRAPPRFRDAPPLRAPPFFAPPRFRAPPFFAPDLRPPRPELRDDFEDDFLDAAMHRSCEKWCLQ